MPAFPWQLRVLDIIVTYSQGIGKIIKHQCADGDRCHLGSPLLSSSVESGACWTCWTGMRTSV